MSIHGNHHQTPAGDTFADLRSDTTPTGDMTDPYAVVAVVASAVRTSRPGSHAERVGRRAYRAALDAAMVNRPELLAAAVESGDVDIEAIGRRAVAGDDSGHAADVAVLISVITQSRARADQWRACLTDADTEIGRLERQNSRLVQTVDTLSNRYAAAVGEADANRREAGRLAGLLANATGATAGERSLCEVVDGCGDVVTVLGSGPNGAWRSCQRHQDVARAAAGCVNVWHREHPDRAGASCAMHQGHPCAGGCGEQVDLPGYSCDTCSGALLDQAAGRDGLVDDDERAAQLDDAAERERGDGFGNTYRTGVDVQA